MRLQRSLLSMVGLLLFLCGLASAQTPVTPKPGSPERKAILDALRVPIEKELKQKVIFRVSKLSVLKGWAFVTGVPTKPNGKPVDYSKTPHQEAIKAGAFDDSFTGLLHKSGKKWIVRVYNLGATDVVWEGWDKEYHAPRAIFPVYH